MSATSDDEAALPSTAEPSPPSCSACRLRSLCLARGIDGAEVSRLDDLGVAQRPLQRGQSLFRSGDPLRALYAVRAGFFKTCVGKADGRSQVTGFQMAGELLGLEAIGDGQHTCEAVALEDSQVCVIPYARLAQLSGSCSQLQQPLLRIMSRELVREQQTMLLLGSMPAEGRVAAFLLDLVQRLHARGYSSSALVLRMTRQDIGSYLGIQLETVSRTLSRLHEDGVLDVHHRQLRVLDEPALRTLATRARAGP